MIRCHTLPRLRRWLMLKADITLLKLGRWLADATPAATPG